MRTHLPKSGPTGDVPSAAGRISGIAAPTSKTDIAIVTESGRIVG